MSKIVLLLVGVTCLFGYVASQSCHLRELDLCAATLLVFTQNPSEQSGTDTEINRQCGFIAEAKECRKNYTDKCTTPLQRDLVNFLGQGGDKTADEFCTPGSQLRADYKKHAKCLGEARNGQRSCNRDLQAALEVVTTASWDNRISSACCAYNRFDECSKEVIVKQCGEEAYILSQKIIRLSASRLPEIVCKAYQPQSKRCLDILPPPGSAPTGAKGNTLISRIFATYVGNF